MLVLQKVNLINDVIVILTIKDEGILSDYPKIGFVRVIEEIEGV